MTLFKDIPILGYFRDFDGDLCQKVSETSAWTPYCAKGWTAGFRPDEPVIPVNPSNPEVSP